MNLKARKALTFKEMLRMKASKTSADHCLSIATLHTIVDPGNHLGCLQTRGTVEFCVFFLIVKEYLS